MKIVQPLVITDALLTSSNVTENDYTAWSATKVYNTGDRVMYVAANVHKNYESLTGSSSTVTMTIASPCVVTWNAHGRAANDPISFTTTGALPTGITANTVYYVLAPTTNSFNISATPGGAAINTSGSQSGVHTATASLNYNKNPTTNPTEWLDIGATNRWKMFDQSVQSQTTRTQNIATNILSSGITDTVVVLNIDARYLQLEVIDNNPSGDGIIFSEFVTLNSYIGITDWYSYFFNPIDKPTEYIWENLPKYADTTVALTVMKDAGETVKCGAALFGFSRDIALQTGKGVEHGAKLTIDDYSVKTRDTFGNYTITERAFNRRSDWTVVIDSRKVDVIYNLLSAYRATPVVYVGGGGYNSMLVYGFYKSFDIDVAYRDVSYCTLQLEGLT